MKKLSFQKSYNPHVLQVLEFDLVRKIVSSFADSEEGISGVSEITPSKDAEIVRALLAEAGEIMMALQFDDPLPGMSIQNIREIFPRLKVRGSNLNIEEIAAVADNLELAHEISQYFEQRAKKYPIVFQITAVIAQHPDIYKDIRKIITPDLEIADDATPELLSIRRKLQRTRSALRKMVEKKLAGLPDDVISERIVTIRDGRHVIPVRDSMKKRVPGAVHDRSQSGKTLFIEPLDTIEGNNNVRELELAEKVEIARILADLTERIASVVDDIEHNQDVLVRLDVITAKARFGVSVEGVIPKINDEPAITIVNGRHPLLDWKFRKNGNIKRVVPLNIEIGNSIRTMVITGPNTVVFAPPEFFADIGDEQSIENDLSTFSSHMKQIVTILKEAGQKTLVLLDELGGGTNPSDGEAIALAVLTTLSGTGAITLASSHHDGLKVFAHETEGVVNASMEFDTKNHMPTFALKRGVPGSSYAFEIAARMGMPEEVLKEAESIGGGEKKSLEGLISEMEEHTHLAKKERESAASERMKMETVKVEYEEKLEEITAQKQDMLSEALAESKKIIEDTNRSMELIIKTMREKEASHEAIVKAKSNIREILSIIKEKSPRTPPKRKKKKKPVGKLEKGLSVWVESLGTYAVVEDILSGGTKARIRAGKSKATIVVEKKNLSAAETPQKKSTQTVIVKTPFPKVTSQEINLRGMTFDEAQDTLDIFLDNLITSGLETAHIIHGKGTGALRSKIGKYLDRHQYVESWRLGNWNEGSFGVTVVKLKK